MNAYLLEGTYCRYVCFSNDLSGIEEQLNKRYSWANNVKISLAETMFFDHIMLSALVTFDTLERYNWKKNEVKLKIFPLGKIPEEEGLLANGKDSYF